MIDLWFDEAESQIKVGYVRHFVVQNKTRAEELLDLARCIASPKERLVYVEDYVSGAEGLALSKLAIEFSKRPDLVFRAIVEEWDRFRILREMY